MAPATPLSFVRSHQGRSLLELKQFLRFPSVSAQPRHAADVRRCADWLATHLRGSGLEHVRVLPTPGHPVVYADWLHAGDRPVVLVYGHYDVQPADPEHAWSSPPFEPVVRGEHLYARGATDDKGQMFAHVKAIEGWLRTRGRLPVNVKCLFEGEEEVGSSSLPAFLRRHQEALAADAAVVSDLMMLGPDRPALTLATRGALSLELSVRGPRRDLHSGQFGGAVLNPLQVLCELVAGLHDRHGRVALPGFYTRVRPLTRQERVTLARQGPSNAEILRNAAVTRGWGEPGYSFYERTTIRPALTVNGLTGGYQGPGGKAIIPAAASAKLSFRLVPDQEPREVERLLRVYVARATPPGVCCAVQTGFASRPTLVDDHHSALRAAAMACRRAFGRPPAFVRTGGTIAAVSAIQERLQLPVVLMGFALPDAHIHAPDERLHLPTFFRSIQACVWFLAEAGRLLSRTHGRSVAEALP
jgi:acetylornithine deacetylase/succinyl-diaminopimelate desuccinylase-like protein